MKANLGQIHAGSIGGEFRAILSNPDGSIAYDSGWEHNRIVDNGMLLYGSTGNVMVYNAIGDDGTATTDGMTALGNSLAWSNSPIASTNSPRPIAGPNYEYWTTKQYRYGAGSGTGTIREMSMGAAINGTDIFCRHVLLTPIVKSSVQTLDVYYKFTVWPSLIEQTGTTTIDSIDYDWASSNYDLDTTGSASSMVNGGAPTTAASTYHGVYSGAKAGQLDAAPSGSLLGAGTNGTVLIDDNGEGYCDWQVHFGLTVGDGVNYLRTFTHRGNNTVTKRQTEFTQQAGQPNPGEGIPKDNTEEITMYYRYTWSRH